MPDKNGSKPSTVGLYRSGITSPEQLRHITVGREHLMADMREKLLGSADKASKQHSLFIGPRGIGKTHLLSLIAQEIAADPKLKDRYIVVRFPEEPLRLLGYVDFLMGVCEILQDALPASESERWKKLYRELVEEEDDRRIRDILEPEIKRASRGQGRTFLVMLENFNEVLDNQIKEPQDAAALRKFFMGDNGCMLIATAPLYFPGVSDVGRPFYDFFDVQIIENLTADETLALIRQNLEWEHQDALLRQFDDLKPKIMALHQMTAGNPRLVVMLYELIAHDSILSVRDQFMSLLDRITPFYQDRIKDLPPQERAIMETIAKTRDTIKTPSVIAARMRMGQQQTSSLLKRLTESQYLKSVPNPDDKRSRIYTIREGFFDLWLAMNVSRTGRLRLPFIVDFFELWYRSLEEREEKRRSLRELLRQSEKSSDGRKKDEAEVALDHLSDVGTAEEKAGAKIRLAHDLADLGREDKAARYIEELRDLELDGLGGWVADHATQWRGQVPNVFAELESMISCWQAQRSGDFEAFAKILGELGGDINVMNYSKARVEFLEESLKHTNAVKQRIQIRIALANTYRMLTEWPKAESHLKTACTEAASQPDQKLLSLVLNQLAVLFIDLARYAEAEPLMRQALEIDGKALGPAKPLVAVRLNNLAQLFQETNRYEEAELLMRRALEIAEKALGPAHPSVATDLNNLAQLFQDTNRLKEAEPLMRRALEIDEKALGPAHPSVATDLNNLAVLLKETNRLEEAEPLMRRALEIDEKALGPAHPLVAVRLNNLAQLFQETNRLEEAEPLMRRALEIDEKALGLAHPSVATDLNNLATLLKETNRLEEAEPLMRRALEIVTNSLEPDHPHTVLVRNNLSTLEEELRKSKTGQDKK